MITVTLIQRGLGVPFAVDDHPAYMDYELRDDPKQSSSSIVDIAEENAIAPLVARLGGVSANESYADLQKAHQRLLNKYPEREDGKRVVEMMIAWGVQWPQGIWEITGRHLDVIEKRGDYAGVDPDADAAPRYSENSVTTLQRNAKPVGEFDAQGDSADAYLSRPEKDITIEQAMVPDYTIQRTGGNGTGRAKKKKPGSDGSKHGWGNGTLLDDGLRPMMASGRVSIEAHTALYTMVDKTGHKIAPGNLMEIVGLAIASGRTYDDVVAALAEGKT